MRARRLAVAAGCSGILVAQAAVAASEPRQRTLTPGEIEAWLEAEPGAAPRDQGTAPDAEEPLPAPRHHGFVVETGLGFVTPLGALEHIAPTAPEFRLRFGYEVFTFLMPFLEGQVAFASTAYANEPPPPRSYFHYGAGAGLRFTVPISRLFAVLAQGSLGLARVSEQNVLSTYGFQNADDPNLYFGGELGLEWYQVNPHLALAAHGGVRSYGRGLARERGGEAPLALLGSAELHYAF